MMTLFEACVHTPPDIRCLPAHTDPDNNDFTTVPICVVSPAGALESKDEEEVYTSFEEALRERAARISSRLHSRPMPTWQRPEDAPPTRLVRGWRAWQRTIAIACLAISLLLAGFDLMGLLIMLR